MLIPVWLLTWQEHEQNRRKTHSAWAVIPPAAAAPKHKSSPQAGEDCNCLETILLTSSWCRQRSMWAGYGNPNRMQVSSRDIFPKTKCYGRTDAYLLSLGLLPKNLLQMEGERPGRETGDGQWSLFFSIKKYNGYLDSKRCNRSTRIALRTRTMLSLLCIVNSRSPKKGNKIYSSLERTEGAQVLDASSDDEK